MPGFVKTKSDEKKWNRAKGIVKDQGKGENWALVNFIYQKMKKKGSLNRFSSIANKIYIEERIKNRYKRIAWGIIPKGMNMPIDKIQHILRREAGEILRALADIERFVVQKEMDVRGTTDYHKWESVMNQLDEVKRLLDIAVRQMA